MKRLLFLFLCIPVFLSAGPIQQKIISVIRYVDIPAAPSEARFLEEGLTERVTEGDDTRNFENLVWPVVNRTAEDGLTNRLLEDSRERILQ